MKALSLDQPYASLLVMGIKQIETRGWNSKHRGELAIHATARGPQVKHVGDYRIVPVVEGGKWAPAMRNDAARGDIRTPLPCGAVVGTVYVHDVIPIVEIVKLGADEDVPEIAMVVQPDGSLWHKVGPSAAEFSDQLPYGDFSHGRFAHMYARPYRFESPIPASGRQRIWNWEER